MRTNQILYGALGLLTLGMASCSSDAPEVSNGKAEKAEVRYMKVALYNPSSSTRAVDNTDEFFEDGTDAENAVNKLWFTFYDATGEPIYTANPNNVTFTAPNPNAPSVGKVQEAVVEIEIAKGESYPAYVMVFANPVSTDGFTEGKGEGVKMDNWRSVRRTDYKNGVYFSMSNSAYYGANDFNGASNVKISATPIAFTKLFTSKALAESAEAEATVDIYIERYAAKVGLTLGEESEAETIKDVTVNNGYTLTFTPQAWTINNDEYDTFVVKRFSLQEESAIPTYAEIMTAMGNWQNGWNDAPLHRSYWACSPSYYNTSFPRVADDIADIAKTGTGAGVYNPESPYSLIYYSYNQITGTKGSPIAADKAQSTRYALENTMAKAAFTEALNPNACGPAAVIVGQYSLKDKEGNAIEGNPTFYLTSGDSSSDLYFAQNPTGVTGSTAMQYLVERLDGAIAVNEDGDPLTWELFNNYYKDNFVIAHPSKTVRQDAAVPHRYVTLQLTKIPTETPLYYKPVGSTTWTQIKATDQSEDNDALTTINTILWQRIGVLRAYTDGKAYFHVLIQHLRAWEDRASDGKPRFIDADGNIDWNLCEPGDFGLVRNHVYRLSIKQIDGIGTGILDPDYPIVPNTKSDNYFIKYRLNILNWRIVPTQGGIVLGN